MEKFISVFTTLIITAYSVFLIPVIKKFLENQVSQYQQRNQKEKDAIEEMKLKYLGPLRLYLVESFIRLYEIDKKISDNQEHQALICIEKPEDISAKNISWMIGEGCYLLSSCYLIACLFFTIKQVRDVVPFLKLDKKQDTEMLKLMESINILFGGLEGGVFYVIQFSLANDIYLSDKQRLMTYREFCEMLQDSKNREWWDGLIRFFIRAGRGENIQRLRFAQTAIHTLSTFLDKQIGQGDSIQSRLEAEEMKNKS